MEIGVSQSIFTQKSTTGATRTVYSSTRICDIFEIFSDISWCGENFDSPWGFGFSILYLFCTVLVTTFYISIINTCVKNTPWHDLHQENFFWYTSIIIYQSGIYQYMNCWLPWHATFILFPHILIRRKS